MPATAPMKAPPEKPSKRGSYKKNYIKERVIKSKQNFINYYYFIKLFLY